MTDCNPVSNPLSAAGAKASTSDSMFEDGDPKLTDEAKSILTLYSGIPEAEMVSHVRRIRDKAWMKHKYPCIGLYYFLDLSLAKSPYYGEVIERIKAGGKFLDLGCCLGQDLRKLVIDDVPAANLTGYELYQDFIDLGYELFRDRDKFKGNMVAGDFLAAASGERMTSGLAPQTLDIIHASAFFHLFDWATQLTVVAQTVHLLKAQTGSMILGRQSGLEKGEERAHPATENGRMFIHDPKTFRELVEEVAQKTGTRLRVKADLHAMPRRLEHTDLRRLVFKITIEQD